MKKKSHIAVQTLLILVYAAAAWGQNSSNNVKTKIAHEPEFPPEAQKVEYGEIVSVLVDVDTNGRVKSARVLGSMAPCSNLNDPNVRAIRKAAVDAARLTVFEPVLDKGEPIDATLLIKYRTRPEKDSNKIIDKKDSLVGGVVNGKAISLPKPDYPAEARASGARGAVSVQVLIGEDGKIISAGAVAGHPDLANSSVKAACKARFTTTLLSGRPVKVSGIIYYNYIP